MYNCLNVFRWKLVPMAVGLVVVLKWISRNNPGRMFSPASKPFILK